MEKINPDDHVALLDEVNQLPHDKAQQIASDLQMHLHKYQELLLDIERTVRNYKETVRKIKGGE